MPPPVSLLDLTAAELMARGIAPIKREFRLPAISYTTSRKPQSAEAAGGGAGGDATAAAGEPAAGAATADDALEAAGVAAAAAAAAGGADTAGTPAAAAAGAAGAAVVAADGEGGHKRVKSKRQRKKERQAAAANGTAAPPNRLCNNFLLGSCSFGDACKFSHDRAAYLAAKPPDLPGMCPFTAADLAAVMETGNNSSGGGTGGGADGGSGGASAAAAGGGGGQTTAGCPFGLSCRWAGTHNLNTNSGSNGAGDAAAAAAAVSDATDADAAATEAPAQPPSAAAIAEAVRTSRQQQEAGLVPSSIPMQPFNILPPQPPINSMGKGLQQQLWKRKYDFGRATAAVAAIRQQMGGGGGGGGLKNAKQQKRQQQQHAQQQQRRGAGVGAGDGVGGDAPAAKRQKVEETAAAAATAANADQTAAGAAGADAPTRSEPAAAAADVVMSDPPAAAAEPAATTAAAAEPAAAVSAEQCEEELDELDALYGADAAAEPPHAPPITPHNSLVTTTQLPLQPSLAAAAADSPRHQLSDAALIAALKSEQEQQQQNQQQQRVGCVAVDVSAAGVLAEPRSRPKLDIAGKTYLAPLTTVGNLPFRRVCVDLGCEVTCGEMALASNLLSGQASEWALLKRHPSEKYFGVQICGGYADQMSSVAQLLDEQLGDGIDFIDINCGCPIDVICSKGAGSSLLLKPRRLEELVRGVTSCINKPVIVKIRKGYYDNADVAHELIPLMPGWGAAGVTLHGRTRQQRYSRAADWAYIRRCAGIASSLGLPLIGNGDVFSPSEWQQRLAAAAAAEPEDDGVETAAGAAAAAAAAAGTAAGDAGGDGSSSSSSSSGCGVATAMIGRAALIKPWLFTEIRENRLWDISASERLDLIRAFVAHGLEAWGSDSRGVETTRKFLLEWLSFTHRYIPVGLLEVVPQVMSWRPPAYSTRSALEGLLSSEAAADWVKISEMFLGPAPRGFTFVPKHKSNAYVLTADALAQMVDAANRGAGGGGGAGGQQQQQQQVEEEEEGEENG